MGFRGASLVFLFLVVAALSLGVLTIGATTAQSSAFSQVDARGFQALTFTKDTNNKSALRIARKFMMQQYDKYNMKHSDMPEIFAQYIKLKGSEEKRFIISYSGNEYGDCFMAGCEIYIYENYEGTRWRQLLNVSANQILIPKEPPADTYGDILMITMYENPSGRAALWSYSDVAQQYKFVKRL